MTLLVLPLYFALSTIETQDQYNRYIFYVVLVAMTWIQLLWYLVFHGPQKTRWTPRWDSNLNLSKLVIAGTAVGGIVSINALIIMLGNLIGSLGQVSLFGFTLSLAPVTAIPPWQSWQFSLFPPIFGTNALNPQVLAWLPLPFANMLQDGLWQTFSIGLAEETLKLTVILVLAKRFQAKIWPVLIVVATWSIAHDIRAYNGNLVAVAGAFAGGLILWGVLIVTECLLAAVICHAGVNVLASLSTYGFSFGSLLSSSFSIGTILALSICMSKSNQNERFQNQLSVFFSQVN